MRKPPLSVQISALYLFAGIVWILVSDRVLVLFAPDTETLALLQTYKGWFYVIVTSLMLFGYIQAQLGRQEVTARALEESEARYRSMTHDVLGQASGGIIIFDADSRVVWLNASIEEMLGISLDEMLGRTVDYFLRTCLTPAVRQDRGAGKEFIEMYSTGEFNLIKGETDIWKGRGRDLCFVSGDSWQDRWVEYYSQPITLGFYAGGRIDYFADITAIIQAAEENRRRALQQEAINAVIVAASQMAGLDELLGMALDRCLEVLDAQIGVIWAADCILSSGVPEGQKAKVHSAVAHYSPVHAECSGCSDSPEASRGKIFSELSPSMVQAVITAPIQAEGKVIGGVTLAADEPRSWSQDEMEIIQVIGRQLGGAVERLELLATTQEQAGQLQLILDTVQEGIIMLNAEKRILVANPAARSMLTLLSGSQPGEVLKRFADLDLEEVLDEGVDPVFAVVSTADPERHFEIHSRRVHRGSADAVWTLLLRDVTEKRQAQERVIRQERRAAIGQLAAGFAHDFNNILASVILYSEMLQGEAGLSERGRERLDMIIQQSDRGARLTNQILDFSRSTAMEMHPVDLAAFMDQIKTLLGRTLPEGIRLSLEYGGDQYVVNMDPNRMRQVFLNLALNSRDAMPGGGTLTFKLDCVEVSGETLPLDGMTPGSWIRISVSDTGCGISAEVREHLFEPFFSTKDPGENTGLGLAQIDGIIKQHDGFIDVESQVGVGTVFHIYLHEVRTGLVPGIIHDVESMLDRGKRIILVVGDDTAARLSVSGLLETMNFKVLQAASGQEAMDTFAVYGEMIDLVLSDQVMSGISGEELFDTLGKRYPGLRMLILTGNPPESADRAQQENGSLAWLQKPVNSADLEAAFRNFSVKGRSSA